MMLLAKTRTVGSDDFRLRVPRTWRPAGKTCWAERVAGPEPDPAAHIVRVDRVLDTLIPLEHLLGIISFKAKSLMPLYEPMDLEMMHVAGAWRAAQRIVYTEESGQVYRIREVFCEGLDRRMWFVRVSAAVDRLDLQLANSIVDSFSIGAVPGHAR